MGVEPRDPLRPGGRGDSLTDLDFLSFFLLSLSRSVALTEATLLVVSLEMSSSVAASDTSPSVAAEAVGVVPGSLMVGPACLDGRPRLGVRGGGMVVWLESGAAS